MFTPDQPPTNQPTALASVSLLELSVKDNPRGPRFQRVAHRLHEIIDDEPWRNYNTSVWSPSELL
jgi:hypothetical protein